MKNQFYALTKNWSRHGAFSGYERLLDFINVPFNIGKQYFLPYRFIQFFASKTQLKNYKSDTVIKEWQFLFKIFKKKNIHVLYGDMDYYYLHNIKKFPFNLKKNKLIATFHHPPYELDKRMGYQRKEVLGALDKIIVMGSNQISYLQQYTQAEIKFIPHGINTQYFRYDEQQVRKNQILLIGVSHRDHVRNLAIIEEVNKQILTSFLVLITPENKHIYASIKNVEVITNKVSDSELLSYYQESKGLLLSLIDCTASNSILEALACGCPLITNKVGAVTDYIPRESGIPVFKTEDLQASSAYIVRLLQDDEFLESISKKQRALAIKYDWKVIAKTTEDFILS
ncbi:glycosyltransferase family 4 protein [Xanthomarina sp. GH4-25]|uniref:glycosyltransferase family 4 protein n=1 Tax=Xanthomarina sp. GH4-25 TaxID=3349335 RepID=UPI0038783991